MDPLVPCQSMDTQIVSYEEGNTHPAYIDWSSLNLAYF